MGDEAETSSTSKADEIMQVGQELMQTRGYDGFSYRDVADRVGIKSATIHYYFPAKADLALAVARQYRVDFAAAVEDLTQQRLDPFEQLVGYAAIFQRTLEDLGRVCLCGMLASEANSLPDVVRAEAAHFFTEQQAWISATIVHGIDSGVISNVVQPESFARTFLSALEGAMIMARSMERPEHLADVSAQLIALLRHGNAVR